MTKEIIKKINELAGAILDVFFFILVDFPLFRTIVRIIIVLILSTTFFWILGKEGVEIPKIIIWSFNLLKLWILIPILEFFRYFTRGEDD